MKIATVTLNPAIDQTVSVNGFQPNSVNRAQTMRFDAGGKGVNVAAFLASAGFDVSVTGFLGQDNAEIFERFFAQKHIHDHFIRIPGQSRIGVKIVDEVNSQTTDINLPGLIPPAEALTVLFDTIEHLAQSCDWFVLAGTLPPGVPATIYATIIAQLKQHGKHVVLDSSAQALREGVLAGPTMIKPNIDELQQLVGYALPDEQAVENAAHQVMADAGIDLIVVSMGERGALFIDQSDTLQAIPPAVTVKSTVGAGDALVAGFIAGQIQGLPLPDCARLATAFSLGVITSVGHMLPESEMVQAYVRQVVIHSRSDISRIA